MAAIFDKYPDSLKPLLLEVVIYVWCLYGELPIVPQTISSALVMFSQGDFRLYKGSKAFGPARAIHFTFSKRNLDDYGQFLREDFVRKLKLETIPTSAVPGWGGDTEGRPLDSMPLTSALAHFDLSEQPNWRNT